MNFQLPFPQGKAQPLNGSSPCLQPLSCSPGHPEPAPSLREGPIPSAEPGDALGAQMCIQGQHSSGYPGYSALLRIFWENTAEEKLLREGFASRGQCRDGFPSLHRSVLKQLQRGRTKVTDVGSQSPECPAHAVPAQGWRDSGSCHPLTRAVGLGCPNLAGAECWDSSHTPSLGFLLRAGLGKAGLRVGLDHLGGLFQPKGFRGSQCQSPGVRHGLSWLLSSLVPWMVWYQLHLTSSDTEKKCKTPLFIATGSSSAWYVS